MKTKVTHATFTIERNYPTTPERVFAAFADPQKKRRWYAEGEGKKPEIFEMDFRVGGSDRTQSRMGTDTPFPGVSLTNHSTYQDIQPNRRIVFAYTMSVGDLRISASLATVEFIATDKGTDLVFTDQGAFFEGSDGPKMREEGWSHLLDGIAAEVVETANAPA
jgi:uncharacterized protein YndB with AHSA1/START domain